MEGSRDNDGAFSLADMQQLVGGYIEAVKLNPVIVHENIRYCWLIINEEGKLLSLPVNKNATLLVKSVISRRLYSRKCVDARRNRISIA